MKKNTLNNLISKNKKAYFDFEIIQTYESWIELRWYEVKSLRLWHVNLKWSFIVSINSELFVKWMHISPWKTLSNISSIDSARQRKIFLHKKDIVYLISKSKEPGFSIIPLELYFVWSLIKLRIWLAKWKKQYQKKQLLKEKTMDREAKIHLKKII